ncbi:hypothetical protein ACFV3R_06885 [Streptomyces sp. NPDC059740]|uniref:hypothetical protein n=1 Tax=Streptomyces sp. NPDC059740 TaxID=3346926 RepID=UPI0036486CC0
MGTESSSQKNDIMEELKGIRDAIPGAGSTKLATESFVRQALGGAGKGTPGKEKKEPEKTPGWTDGAATLAGIKDVTDKLKEVSGGLGPVTIALSAMIGTLGLKLIHLDAIPNAILARFKKKIGTTKSGVLPKVVDLPEEVTNANLQKDIKATRTSVKAVQRTIRTLNTTFAQVRTSAEQFSREMRSAATETSSALARIEQHVSHLSAELS